MLIAIALMLLLLTLGIFEKIQHQKNINSIPIRINVNGTRGKSTVTRLITAIFAEAGIKVVGKTTGTSARMLYWFTDEEEPIVRRPEGPNIREQKMVVKQAVLVGAKALVSECMALNPDYQRVFQKRLLQANIGVITNVLEDHMDVMGPTLDEVAKAFASTIPYRGYLIVMRNPYLAYFQKLARERETRVIIADASVISEDYLARFKHVIFPENVALALAVAKVMKLSETNALQAMLNARPDLGALRIFLLSDAKGKGYFVNGFAANDPRSTLDIWRKVEELGYPVEAPVIIMNCRKDRWERSQQFVAEVLPYISSPTLILIGDGTKGVVKAVKKSKIRLERLVNLEHYSGAEILSFVRSNFAGRTIFGIGNIHGAGAELVEYLLATENQHLVRKVC